MYKNVSRFMQREARHDSALDKLITRDNTKPLKNRPQKHKLSTSEKARRAANKEAKKEREIIEAGITSSFITAVGPLVRALNLKGGTLANELNRRGIKTPNGGDWNKSAANHVRSQVFK